MNPIDTAFLQEFVQSQLQIPSLRLFLSEKIHAGVPEYRALLRQYLQEEFISSFPEASRKFPDILDRLLEPGTRLPMGEVHFSLSHSKKCSGYAVASSGSALGFDIEEMSRATPKLSQRIRHAEDLSSAVISPLFWSAKESAYKALCPSESSTVSQIAITSWDETTDKKADKKFVVFEAQAPTAKGKGVVTQIQSLSTAIFLKGTSFSR